MNQDFQIEIALVHITGRDLSRARHYLALHQEHFLKKWERLTSYSDSSKHELASTLQKAWELKEFLDIASTPVLNVDSATDLMTNWSDRSANPSYDSIATRHAILCFRAMYSFYLSTVKSFPEETIEL